MGYIVLVYENLAALLEVLRLRTDDGRAVWQKTEGSGYVFTSESDISVEVTKRAGSAVVIVSSGSFSHSTEIPGFANGDLQPVANGYHKLLRSIENQYRTLSAESVNRLLKELR